MAFRELIGTALVGCVWLAGTPGQAKDFGTHGPIWEVAEPSLLEAIQSRLQAMEANGELAEMRQEMQDKTRAYVQRPRPVTGLAKAQEERVYEVDLSITVSRDIADHRGVVFARAGSVINPLHFSRFNKRIVVFDGDDDAQVEFALAEGNELDTLLVLTNGDPLALMREHGRRFYFDQDRQIVDKFGVTAVPVEITRGLETMVVREVPVGETAE